MSPRDNLFLFDACVVLVRRMIDISQKDINHRAIDFHCPTFVTVPLKEESNFNECCRTCPEFREFCDYGYLTFSIHYNEGDLCHERLRCKLVLKLIKGLFDICHIRFAVWTEKGGLLQ